MRLNVESGFSNTSSVCVAIFSAYRAFSVKIRLLEFKHQLELGVTARCSEVLYTVWNLQHLHVRTVHAVTHLSQSFTTPTQWKVFNSVHAVPFMSQATSRNALQSWGLRVPSEVEAGFSRVNNSRCWEFEKSFL
ncbi:hypothetical protein Mapa_008542 [Marchantia paleacea]|nr:hypothetical protein Mapa_008542 [Marchantia paleacea]